MFRLFFSLFVLCFTIVSSSNPYCQLSCDFGTENITHTVCDRNDEKCGPSEMCGPDFKIVSLTNKLRQFIVDKHNILRNKVAIGNETRNKQPSATNMKTMVYDKELEFIAQCWANACNGDPLLHDVCRRTEKFEHVGQNLGFVNSTANNIDVRKSIDELIQYWYDEVAIFNNTWVSDTRDRGADFKVGHYTQMLWSDTYKVGCAAVKYTSPNFGDDNVSYHFLFVCNYGPGGNYISFPVYNQGVPCSECPEKLKCNKRYKGLCGMTLNVTKTLDKYKSPFL